MANDLQNIYAARVAAGDLQQDPAQTVVLQEFERICEYFDQPENGGLLKLFEKKAEPPQGVYLWGGVGRGKSMLMDMFFEAVEAPKRRVHFHAFMQEIHSGMHEARKTGVDDALKPVASKIAAEAKLLAFDEMQISDITDAMIVGRLFEHLFSAGVIVVTTSNRAPKDLYKDCLNRQLFLPFIDMLNAHMHIHHLVSPTDYRQETLSGSQVYFAPANAHAKQQIDLLWLNLTGGGGELFEFQVKGRPVSLPLFKNGAARVDFWDLCGRPLGAADYLALVENVRVLFIENIPALSRQNFNEAKRFVTLIDTLYEAKTRVIFSAADVPERLYLEGEGVFEFERTASRLKEMQSEDWAAES